ncbi:hypothetical protein BMS80_09200 [Leuconostoc pseudomesenteroides]|uniref:hypothetical protein n=1 Tax=Leuconostoc falkenbergense TaxID=2766470 RepID=UPI0009B5D695|nr:hypothetical protein [Leuconostoc falkenbergense]MDG9745742.1 hypothetical protein [Leuconostoc falkenbergense]OQJ70566.1 hypothetical protein BMS80_09200 [Leuconostoc pseudomesenteroides]ORI49627.1 hypothetical protein BMS85_09955 [Leuconostoc pseudomesenteroides]ORI55794.1 hypothetical protein BMS88_09810 [Leuconostoc pseudomesenteroides]
MTETVVHVTTLEQWRSVLDVWFKQRYEWPFGNKEYRENLFEDGGRFLFLDNYIAYNMSNPSSKPFIEYSEFMAQQKENNKMETYYVTEEQLDFIQELKEKLFPLHALLTKSNRYENIKVELSGQDEKALLRYLGGDTSIKFKVKEQLYRLWRIDSAGDKVYMTFSFGTPTYIPNENYAFTAPLEEIKKWETPAWSLEKVD